MSTAAVGIAGIAAGHAMPLNAGSSAMKDAADTTDHVDQVALYVVEGRRYCFYFDGWHGAGWYRCGFAWRRGLGWGGVYGWQGWEYGPAARRFGRGGVSVRESSRGVRDGATIREGSRTTVRERGSVSTREGASVRERSSVRGETTGRATSDGASVRSRTGVRSETTGRASRDGGGSAGGEVRRSPGGGGAAVEGGGAVRGGGAASGGGGASVGGGRRRRRSRRWRWWWRPGPVTPKTSKRKVPGMPRDFLLRCLEGGPLQCPRYPLTSRCLAPGRIPYSSVDRLTGPLLLPGPLKRLIGRALLERNQEPERGALAGCFCSELVAKFYELLGLRLFARPVAPENVSPNRLRSWWQSRLLVVPDAILTAADIPDDAYADVVGILQLDVRTGELDPRFDRRRGVERPSYVKSLIDVRAAKAALEKQKKWVESQAADVKEIARGLRAAGDLRRAVQGAKIDNLVFGALSVKSITPSVARKLDDLLHRSVYLRVLRDHLRSEAVPGRAGNVMRQFHDRELIELGELCARLLTFVARAREPEPSPEMKRQRWLRMLAECREKKTRRAQPGAAPDTPVPRKPGQGSRPDDDTDAWIRKVGEAVLAKTDAEFRSYAQQAAERLTGAGRSDRLPGPYSD